MSEANDAIQSLARIISAAARLMAVMHRSGVVDPAEEIPHMQANLDHVRKAVEEQ